MILGIDAFNLRAGGGVTHLIELLRAMELPSHGFRRVIVWGGAETLGMINERAWLHKVHEPLLDRSLLHRIFWQRFRLRKLAACARCDVLFVPGGSDASGFKPIVTMSRNMLPFEWREMLRYGWTSFTLKLLLLRWTQSRSFQKAQGVIFLTEYAHDAVLRVTGSLSGNSRNIPHGVNPRFARLPRPQRLPHDFTCSEPCRLLYVSIVDRYKHQWIVAEAVARLRSEGISIALELVGPPAGGLKRLKETLTRVDPKGAFITYRGAVPYEKLDQFYENADIGVFASSCENMPNILLEGMAAGLPMACSRMGPMPEVLGDAGVYFDPESSNDVARALRELIMSSDMRAKMARSAFDRAQTFSWHRCADDTLDFLAECSHAEGNR